MKHIKPLPGYLVQRYHGWKATTHRENHAWYKRLAEEGQRPRSMVIACCDSRVHVASIFEADRGEFFIHRNVANLVPPYEPDGQHHGTSAAIDYAVTSLKVANILVVGHSNCGGVQGCYDMCEGQAPALEETASFVGRWLDLLRPGYDRLPKDAPEAERRAELEKQAVLVSLENLITYPFVQEARERDELSLHGLWNDIGEGTLEFYDPASQRFLPL